MAPKIKSSTQQPHTAKPNKKHHYIMIATMVVSFLVLGFVVAAIGWYYRDRALPNVSLGNIDVSGKTKDQIKQIAQKELADMSITFQNGDQKVQASLADVGVNVDIDASVNQAASARRDWLDLVLAWEHHNVPLVYTTDLGVAKTFAKAKFPNQVTDAVDAQLVFNTNSKSYDIQPGTPGVGFDTIGFVKAVQNLADSPQAVTLPLSTMPVQPVVQTAKLEPVQQQANKVKDLKLAFNYQGKTRYTADPADIAGWTHFSPNTANNSVTVSYDQGAIEQFLRDKVGASIAAKAQDRKVVQDAKTGKEIVIVSGQQGQQLADMDKLAQDVINALQNNQSLTKDVSVTTSPFKTITLADSDRWIEVDLSEQKTTLWLGATPVQSFLISSGIWKHPTVTGEFAIHYKTVNQVMTGGSKASGDYYYLPNVTWVSYFYQDYAFHTAYWHNNFGHPMSHGCINMRAADAKVLYDFAPLGTRVVVHD